MSNIHRVATVAYDLPNVKTYLEFYDSVAGYVLAAKENAAEVVVLPEYLTTPLALLENGKTLEVLASFTDKFVADMEKLAKAQKITIVAGTHIVKKAGKFFNTSFVFNKNGLAGFQEKIHLTPWEKRIWKLSSTNTAKIFDLGFAKSSIPICYDIEFPELARVARKKGAEIFLVPTATDDLNGVMRIKHCAGARAIENKVFVAVSHVIGSIPLNGMRVNWGNSYTLAPCDSPFNAGGVLVESAMNIGTISFADLDMDALAYCRKHGSVTTWEDIRKDIK